MVVKHNENKEENMCNECPRQCKSGRFCGIEGIKVAKVMRHYYEEPVISGTKGSGAIFFSGCNLRCCYCQNMPISHGNAGRYVSQNQLYDEILNLQKSGAHNINLVTAAHIKSQLGEVLRAVKPKLNIPVIYNSSGYEGDLSILNGLIDVYLPDFKYMDSELSARYSKAPDYPSVAMRAIAQMIEQVGAPVFADGLIVKGVIIRHLVLPSHRDDSMRVVDHIASHFPSAYVSLMSQYTPQFNVGPKELFRRITSFEYNSVVNHAAELGLKGFIQERSSASPIYTPSF